jgi:hypothetical protein
LYWTYDRGFFNRNQMRKRSPGTESAGIGYKVDSTSNYFCDVLALHHDIDDQIRANADSPLNLDRESTLLLTMQALIYREVYFAANFLTTGIWTTDVTGVSASPTTGQVLQWNDANSTPIENVRTAKRVVAQSTGFEPNVLTLGRAVYDALIDHPDIVDRIKYATATNNEPAKANLVTLASLFEVDEILVSNAIYNTATEGQTASHSFVAGKTALLTYRPPAPGLMTPSAGYTFSWTGYVGAQSDGQRLMRYRIEPIKSDRIEIEMAFTQGKVAADLGYFFTSIVA